MHIVFKPGVLIRSSFEVVSDHTRIHAYTHTYIHRYRVSSLHKLDDRYILAFANQVPVVRKCPLHTRACTHTHTHRHTHIYIYTGSGHCNGLPVRRRRCDSCIVIYNNGDNRSCWSYFPSLTCHFYMWMSQFCHARATCIYSA
jgi:hypothetical protein